MVPGAEVEEEVVCSYAVEELEEKVREALRGTSNRSAPGPDGISYRFIKTVLDTKLGEEVVREVAESLKEGRIPEAWQNSKVVFIPKPNKDHKAAKGWRPIKLINCVGKLAEKVVADELQEAELFHKGQFGGVKGRSALEAMTRVLTRAQRALSRGGQVLWVMEDVRGGFNNVLGQEVLDAVGRSEKKGWCQWLKDFFRPRQFEVKWDGKVQGWGSANVRVPQGSPLSPVVFFIWMAPILKKLKARLRENAGVRARVGAGNRAGAEVVVETDVELPSFVNNMCADIIVWERGCNMNRVEDNVKRTVWEVAEECQLPIETDKEEVLHLRTTRKRRNTERKYVKWLGVIFDDSLEFDMH